MMLKRFSCINFFPVVFTLSKYFSRYLMLWSFRCVCCQEPHCVSDVIHNIRIGLDQSKHILLVTEELILFQVLKNLLIDYDLKKITDEIVLGKGRSRFFQLYLSLQSLLAKQIGHNFTYIPLQFMDCSKENEN